MSMSKLFRLRILVKKVICLMLLHIFMLVSALCLDTFAAFAAYGAGRIDISHTKILMVNVICSLCLGFALLFGTTLDSLIPETFTKTICFVSLMLLGILKLADSSIRSFLRLHKPLHKNIGFCLSHLHFVIDIYSDPMAADTDQNQHLSWKEAVFFSFAMSADSLIAGTMAAFLKVPTALTVLAAFLMGEALSYLGLFMGHKISSHCPKDLSWLGGILFLLLAFLKAV